MHPAVPTQASPAAYLCAFALTLAVELPVYVLFARAARWAGAWRALAGALGVNVVTHPVLYAAGLSFVAAWQLVVAEAVVALVEAGLLVWWWRVRERAGVVTVACVAVAANATSTAVGLLR